MAEKSGGSGGSVLAFMVGGLLVAVAALGVYMYSSSDYSNARQVDVNVSLPKTLPAPALPKAPSMPSPQPLPAPTPAPMQ
jgi:hypothetical protein